MNYMEQVAQMLGVELGEEFRIRKGNNSIKKDTFYLTKGGMYKNGSEFPVGSLWDGILAGYCEIVKIPKQILTKKEEEYLSYVLRPFKDTIKYIYKFTCMNGDYEVIAAVRTGYGDLVFPPFKKGTMYQGMEICRHYTIDELGL